MQNHIKVMHSILGQVAESLRICPRNAVYYNDVAHTFFIPDSSIEIILASKDGLEKWIVQEVYQTPDLQNGGHVSISSRVGEYEIGDEILAAKDIFMKIIERKIHAVLDKIS